VAASQGQRAIVRELLAGAQPPPQSPPMSPPPRPAGPEAAPVPAAPVPVDARDGRMGTPLIHAAESGSVRLVQDLLAAAARAEAVDAGGFDAFAAACANGHVLVAARLLAGRDVNAAGGAGGPPPLHAAARCGRTEMVRFLLAVGADPALVAGRVTAAELARAMGHEETARAIEEFDEEEADAGRLDWRVQCVRKGVDACLGVEEGP